MSRHPRAGHKAERKERATPATPPASASEQNPLDFALSFMRDDSKPDTLRVSVAKAAMPYLHKRGEERDEQEDAPEAPPMSDLELARRIAHILARGKEQVERERAEPLLEKRTPPGSPRSLSSGRASRGPVGGSPPSPEGKGERGPDDPFDPHRGYRWI